MFFTFSGQGPKTEDSAKSSGAFSNEVKLNKDGEPMFLQGQEGELIINDPTLLISKEAGKEPLCKEELTFLQIFMQGLWVPLLNLPFWNQQQEEPVV